MRPLSILPARLEYACGHAGLVSLPLVKGESRRQRSARVEGEKVAARLRSCDFCGPSVSAAAVVGVVTAPNGGPGSSPTMDLRDARAMVNNADGALPVGQPEPTTAFPTAGSSTEQTSSGGTESTPGPAAQQPKRARSSRAMQRPSAEPERQAAALERTVESERPTRRRLSVDQQREIARLYAETSTPTSEIRKQFGIGESSLYRIVQRQGVPLRGRRGSSTPTEAPAPAARPGAAAALPPVLARGGGRGAVRRATSSASRRTASAPAGGRGQFRIQFWGERVVQARDIRDALRQAESLGGLEVTSITRED